MFRKSIRWELPFSYAMIALLSVVALGTALVFMLSNYYTSREVEYLLDNANAIAISTRELLTNEVPMAVMRAHIESYAFLSQARIRLFDDDGIVLIDSGLPRRHNILSISAQPPADEATAIPTATATTSPNATPAPITTPNYCYYASGLFECLTNEGIDLPAYQAGYELPIEIPLSRAEAVEYYTPVMTLNFRRSGVEQGGDFVSVLPATRTLYGFGLSTEASTGNWRSNQVATRPVVDEAQGILGFIELSQGPAYGREILDALFRSLLAASILAVVVGAGVGATISRRITKPLYDLTLATGEMAAGKLTVRAKVLRGDEMGLLAISFNHMAERVEQTIATLRRFVADAAHELHTPITALRANIELALAEVADSPYPGISYEYLQRAEIQIERLQSLTDSLLDLSRLESRMEQKDHRAFLLSDVVSEAGEIYASRAEQMGLNFELTLPPHPVFLTGNATQLRAALGNLLSNAIKFTPEGGTVALRLCETDEAVSVEVSDTGIGIPPEATALLFERFYRAPNAAAYPGSGLGLTIVKSIIDSHGGSITAQPAQPGTRFTVTFPTHGEAGD